MHGAAKKQRIKARQRLEHLSKEAIVSIEI
jgi:hypothetical protein